MIKAELCGFPGACFDFSETGVPVTTGGKLRYAFVLKLYKVVMRLTMDASQIQ